MIDTGFVSDKIGRRGPVCFAAGLLLTFSYSILAAWHVSEKLKMAVFILVVCYGCYTPLLAGCVNASCGGDQQLRAFLLGMMVSVGQAIDIPFQQLQLPSGQAPDFSETHGWGSALAFVVALTLWTGVGIDLTQKPFENKVPQERSDVESVE